jgi:hypothetical protein
MFRSIQTIITQRLQNCHCTRIPPYFGSTVTVAWWWSDQTETYSHTSVKISVAVFDGFMADCFGNAGKVKNCPCVYWSIVPLLALDKSVDGRIRYKEEHQINLAKSQYTTTKTYLSKMKLPSVGVHNLVPKWNYTRRQSKSYLYPTGRRLRPGTQNRLHFP